MRITLLILFIFICSIYGKDAKACPIWYVGKIKIVDKHFKEIESAKICQYFRNGDSSYYTKSYRFRWGKDTSGEKDFRIWGGGGYWRIPDQAKHIEYKYKITANGYADLFLKNFNLQMKDWRDSTSIFTVLYIVMPTKKFVVNRGKTKLKTVYRINERIVAKDTAILDIQNQRFTNLQFKEQNKIAKKTISRTPEVEELKSDLATETYPNPVKNTFHINIPSIYELGQKVSFYNLAGQEIKSFKIYNKQNTIDLNWLENGTYFFIIYDKNGYGIHKEKLLKI